MRNRDHLYAAFPNARHELLVDIKCCELNSTLCDSPIYRTDCSRYIEFGNCHKCSKAYWESEYQPESIKVETKK